MSDFDNKDIVPAGAEGKKKAAFDMETWWNKRNLAERIVLGIAFALVAVGGMAAFTYVFMLVWNLVIPAIFGAGVVNFWQALGLQVLSWIIFGSGNAPRGKKRKVHIHFGGAKA